MTPVRKDPKRQLEPKLLDIINEAPTSTGVYYMHKADGTIIYIGKSKNIKKRLTQHFTSDNRKSKRIQLEVSTVTFEETGNDLIAQLKESAEIKLNKPVYNRALRRTIFNYQLTTFTDEVGYINLKIEKSDARKKALITFTSFQQAKTVMFKITEENQLCQKLTGIHTTSNSCFAYNVKECKGACIGQEPTEEYNERVYSFIKRHAYENNSMLIIDKGRDVDERSVVFIENGVYKGYGYFNLNFQINNPEILKTLISPMKNNRDTQHIIQTYLRKNRVMKIVNLP